MNLERLLKTVHLNLPLLTALVLPVAAQAHEPPLLSQPMSHFLACLIERKDAPESTGVKAMSFGFATSDGIKTAYFKPGETVQFALTASADGFYYCYYQQSDGSIIRLAPSVYSPNHFISRNTTHTVPGGQLMRVRANRSNSVGELMCVLSEHSQSEQLVVSGKGKIEIVPLATLCQVYCFHQTFSASAIQCESAEVRIGLPSVNPESNVVDKTASTRQNRCSC